MSEYLSFAEAARRHALAFEWGPEDPGDHPSSVRLAQLIELRAAADSLIKAHPLAQTDGPPQYIYIERLEPPSLAVRYPSLADAMTALNHSEHIDALCAVDSLDCRITDEAPPGSLVILPPEFDV